MEKNKLNMKIVNEIDELIGRVIRTKEISERKKWLIKSAQFINVTERIKFKNQEETKYEWTNEYEIDWACDQLIAVSRMF